jgi:hypothetical protein
VLLDTSLVVFILQVAGKFPRGKIRKGRNRWPIQAIFLSTEESIPLPTYPCERVVEFRNLDAGF